jgi:hypothetical protein
LSTTAKPKSRITEASITFKKQLYRLRDKLLEMDYTTSAKKLQALQSMRNNQSTGDLLVEIQGLFDQEKYGDVLLLLTKRFRYTPAHGTHGRISEKMTNLNWRRRCDGGFFFFYFLHPFIWIRGPAMYVES